MSETLLQANALDNLVRAIRNGGITDLARIADAIELHARELGGGLRFARGSGNPEAEPALFRGPQRIEQVCESAHPVLHGGLEIVPAGGAVRHGGERRTLQVDDHDGLAGAAFDREAAQVFEGDDELVEHGAHGTHDSGAGGAR
jgi:hypothetical protein